MERKPLHLAQGSNDGHRKIWMTKKCKKEFDGLTAERRQILQNTMKLWANAKSEIDEPAEHKFKRLGAFDSGSDAAGDVEMVEFKFEIARVYGVETEDDDCVQIVLTRASTGDKSGKKKQTSGIETAAKRFGSWHDGN
jgi:hypothetical protein